MVPWSATEDTILLSAVADTGPRKDWRAIAARLPGRSAAAARYRWRECNAAVRGRAESAAAVITPVVAIAAPVGAPTTWPDCPLISKPRRALTKTERRGCGPWELHVDQAWCSSRAPTPRQLLLLRRWRLDRPRDRPFVCNLSRGGTINAVTIERSTQGGHNTSDPREPTGTMPTSPGGFPEFCTVCLSGHFAFDGVRWPRRRCRHLYGGA